MNQRGSQGPENRNSGAATLRRRNGPPQQVPHMWSLGLRLFPKARVPPDPSLADGMRFPGGP